MISHTFRYPVSFKWQFVLCELFFDVHNLLDLLLSYLLFSFSQNLFECLLFWLFRKGSDPHRPFKSLTCWNVIKFSYVWIHLRCHETVLNQLLPIGLIESTESCFWTSLLSLRNWHVLKINHVAVLHLCLLLLIPDPNFIGHNSGWLSPSFLLSFGPAFLFGPF